MFLSRLTSFKGAILGAAAIASLAFTSCNNSFIYDDLPECVPEYRVRLSYDRNMSSTEQVHKVEAAEIYAFDADGNLAATAVADKQTLIDNDYTLPIKLNRFETYDLVVWGGLTAESPFKLDGTRAVTSKEDLTCRLTTVTDEEGNQTSSSELPHLFHGAQAFTFTQEEGTEEQTIKLTKNTNIIKVVIRKDNGDPIARNEYTVRILDKNAVMAHDNSLKERNTVTYHPVKTEYGEFETSDGTGNSTGTFTRGASSEFHVARLMENEDPRLEIIEGKTKRAIADIKVMEMIRHAYESMRPEMDFQDYLDRQDEYDVDLSFHVEDMYLHLAIIVNGWMWVSYDIEWD